MNRNIQFSKPPPAVSPEGFIAPLYGAVSSSYGRRELKGEESWHRGIDVAGKLLVTPVFAAREGLVRIARRSKTFGLWIEIGHPEGWATRYGHLSWIHVSKGQKVERGDLIGRIGNSGRSYGAHLHFEVLHNGQRIDPLSVVPLPKPKPKAPPRSKTRRKPKPPPEEQKQEPSPSTGVPTS